MKLELTHDAKHDVWTLKHFDCHLNTDADIGEWSKALETEFKKLGSNKAYLLIDDSDFSLSPAVSHHFGDVAKSITYSHALGIARYKLDHDHTNAAIHDHLHRSGHEPNVFDDRESALAHLEKLRASKKGN